MWSQDGCVIFPPSSGVKMCCEKATRQSNANKECSLSFLMWAERPRQMYRVVSRGEKLRTIAPRHLFTTDVRAVCKRLSYIDFQICCPPKILNKTSTNALVSPLNKTKISLWLGKGKLRKTMHYKLSRL